MKKEQITSLWMQGLLMAATVAVAMSAVDPAWAQLSQASTQSSTEVFNPIIRILGYLAYLIGFILVISGIGKLNAHVHNPTGTPAGQAFMRLLGGAGCLALPYIAGMLSATSKNVNGTQATFTQLGFTNGQ